MISVLLVDDHTAVRAGLVALVRAEPGLDAAAVASTHAEAMTEAQRSTPDVVLVDYHLPDGDGLSLCRELKRLDRAPAVLMYSAFASDRLGVASVVAGADGLLEKGAPADELFDAIRSVARGGALDRPLDRDQIAVAGAALHPDDLPIFGMLLERTPLGEIASTLRVPEGDLEQRVDSMVRSLRPPVDRLPPVAV